MSVRALVSVGAVMGILNALATPAYASRALETALADFLSGDFKAACKLIEPLANAGDAEALYHLAVGKADGECGQIDKKAAFAYYKQSADLGFPVALYSVANAYRTCTGVAMDKQKAADYYRQAADLGVSSAMVNLGLMLINGDGIEQDWQMGYAWMLKASDYQEDVWGKAINGSNFEIIYETEKESQADEWRTLASEGDAEANYRLGRMLLNSGGDLQEMHDFYRVAAEAGHPMAMLRMGQAAFQSSDQPGRFPVDYNEAWRWLSKAALAGEPMSLAIMGKLMRDGYGVTTNRVAAYTLFMLSIWHGQLWIMNDRTKLAQSMSDAELDQADAWVLKCRTVGLDACGILPRL